MLAWNIVDAKFSEAKLSKYVYIWYEFNAHASYQSLEEKKASRNKFSKLNTVISFFLSFCENIGSIGEKPYDVEELEIWMQHLLDISTKCSFAAFRCLAEHECIDPKFKNVDSLTLTSLFKGIKKYEKKENGK